METDTHDRTNVDSSTPVLQSASQCLHGTVLRQAHDLIEELQASEASLRRQLEDSRARCMNYFRAQLKLTEELAVLEDELEATRESRDLAEQRVSLLEAELRCSRNSLELVKASQDEHRGMDWAAARAAARVQP